MALMILPIDGPDVWNSQGDRAFKRRCGSTSEDGHYVESPARGAWLWARPEELIAGKTIVLVVARPQLKDKKGAYGLTTIYLPASQEDLDEIARLDAQAEDE